MSGSTKVFTVGTEGVCSPAIREAARILAAGGLVAFPTETVYGIGADADDRAVVDRLYEVKGRPAEKALSLHLADREDLGRHVRSVPVLGRKLVDKFWPGPLTIVFGRGPEAVGVRLPAHEVARAFLRACGVAVVAPSANLSGEPPASTAAEVLAVFDGKIDAVLDGGAAPLRQASTVVRVWVSGWELLREGIISESSIVRALKRNVLFICTGNSCRSPLAEAVCRRVLAERLQVREGELAGMGYAVLSAGTATAGGSRASQSAVTAGRRAGLDLSGHRSRALTIEMLEEADQVYAMTAAHAEAARRLYPQAAGKVVLLDPEGGDIEDPVGWSAEQFGAVIARVREAIERRAEQLV